MCYAKLLKKQRQQPFKKETKKNWTVHWYQQKERWCFPCWCNCNPNKLDQNFNKLLSLLQNPLLLRLESRNQSTSWELILNKKITVIGNELDINWCLETNISPGPGYPIPLQISLVFWCEVWQYKKASFLQEFILSNPITPQLKSNQLRLHFICDVAKCKYPVKYSKKRLSYHTVFVLSGLPIGWRSLCDVSRVNDSCVRSNLEERISMSLFDDFLGQQLSFCWLCNRPGRKPSRAVWKKLHFIPRPPVHSLHSCRWNLLP